MIDYKATNKRKNVRRILENAVSPYDVYCDGYGNHESRGCYITAPVIGTGKTQLDAFHTCSSVLEKICAYDNAESQGAYVGQTNMVKVSSFCGLNGLVWGLDIMKSQSESPALVSDVVSNFTGVAIHDLEGVLTSSARLFGTVEKKRFPIIPGAIVPCAYKMISEKGPAILYAGLAIGIPNDETEAASLFMEDVGAMRSEDLASFEDKRQDILAKLICSVVEVGANNRIDFARVYVGIKSLKVEADETGCVLVAVPYITLAGNALTKVLLDNITDVTIDDWEKEVSSMFYCARDRT